MSSLPPAFVSAINAAAAAAAAGKASPTQLAFGDALLAATKSADGVVITDGKTFASSTGRIPRGWWIAEEAEDVAWMRDELSSGNIPSDAAVLGCLHEDRVLRVKLTHPSKFAKSSGMPDGVGAEYDEGSFDH